MTAVRVSDRASPPDNREAFPLGPSPGRLGHRFEGLDALRGICAVMVCLFHFHAEGPISALPLVRASWLFVDFFFVLSGFVIAANYRQRLVDGGFVRNFVILRFGRVYPLHLAVLLAFVVTECLGVLLGISGSSDRAMFEGHRSLPALFTNLTLLQSFGLHDSLTWNKPAWSIAVEFWTYLLFALLARSAGASLEKWLAVIVIGCIATLLVVTPNGINVTYSWSIIRCIYGFAIGALTWWAWQAADVTSSRPYRLASLVEVGTLAVVVGLVSLGSAAPANLVAPLIFGAAVLVFARAGGRISQWLLRPALRRLGLLSFSIYMVHSFVQARLADVLRGLERFAGLDLMGSEVIGDGRVIAIFGTTPWQGTVLTAVMLAIVVMVAEVTWRLVEVPGQQWARQRVPATTGLPSASRLAKSRG